MRVLVACEFSGIVRDAFRARGHDAWSCDLVPSEAARMYHIQGDVLGVLGDSWDMVLAFPPCTHLAVSGARWFAEKRRAGLQADAVRFFMAMIHAPAEYVCVENPVGLMSSYYRPPDQIIQPWQFGHGETKATCLWLKNLPPLVPSRVVEGREPRVHRLPPSPERSRLRSESYVGVAEAMADQWGDRARRLLPLFVGAR